MRAELTLAIGFATALAAASLAPAQPCDDFNECTVNNMCSEGFCVGDPVLDGSCDDENDCTVNDRCAFNEVAMLSYCEGDPVENGTVCNQGCGRCSAGFCRPDPAQEGQACTREFGLCTLSGQCLFSVCLTDPRQGCPTTDPCRLELCNPLTGQCEDAGFSPCGQCSTCRPLPSSRGFEPPPFECVPADEGAVCDDENECTGDGICEFGSCYPGPPIGETPVETPEPTSTPVPTEPPPTSSPTSPAATSTSTPPIVMPTSTPSHTATMPVTPEPTSTPMPTEPVPTSTPTTIAARLAAAIDAVADMIPLDDITGFPPTGTVRIGDELIRYSSIVTNGTVSVTARAPRGAASGGTLVVQERGAGGTTPQAHAAGELVVLVPAEPTCVGDCGNDGEVTVDELIVGVNIALGETPVDACPAFDSDGSGDVTVDEILTAVNNALDGCA